MGKLYDDDFNNIDNADSLLEKNEPLKTYGSFKNSQKKNLKNRRRRQKAAGLLAAALTFGAVAGTTAYGVSSLENKVLSSSGTTSEADAETDKETTAQKGDAASYTSSDNSSAASGSVADVATGSMPAMVTISTMSVQQMNSLFGDSGEYEVEGAGSGVIIKQTDDELLIATNNHVIEGATELSVGFADETAVSAGIKGKDPENDLAIVSVKLSDIPEDTLSQLKVISIGDSDELKLGEQVVAIGNALGLGQSVTSGYVSALNRSIDLSDGTNTFTSEGLIQTDASINSGNSGGALLNMNGELIGINEAKSSAGLDEASVDNVGYAIPISKAMPILEELMNGETKTAVSENEQGYLGVNCVDISEESSSMYNMPTGAYINDIVENSPAAEAGLQQGDILTAINSDTINSYSELASALRYYAAGDTITVTYQRTGSSGYEEQTAKITLGSADEYAPEENTDEDAFYEDSFDNNPHQYDYFDEEFAGLEDFFSSGSDRYFGN